MTPIEACVMCHLDARRHIQQGGSPEDPYYKQLKDRARRLWESHTVDGGTHCVPRDAPLPSVFITIDGDPEDYTPPTHWLDRITTWLWGRPQ